MKLQSLILLSVSATEAQEMATVFVKWFYELLNHKSSSSSESPNLRQDLFYPDANARISLQSQNPDDSTGEVIQVQNNGPEVCQALCQIVQR